MQCPIWLFSVVPRLHGFLVKSITYFLNDFEIVPVAPIVTGITFIFTFHVHCISIVRSLYFRNFSAFFKSHFCLLRLQRLLTYIIIIIIIITTTDNDDFAVPLAKTMTGKVAINGYLQFRLSTFCSL